MADKQDTQTVKDRIVKRYKEAGNDYATAERKAAKQLAEYVRRNPDKQ